MSLYILTPCEDKPVICTDILRCVWYGEFLRYPKISVRDAAVNR